MNIREMQIIGALYFKKYCTKMKIEHFAIDEFFEHFLNIATSQNLPGWETTGAHLAITGRGDMLPNDLCLMLGDDLASELLGIANSTCEISLSQMYGNVDLRESAMFLEKVEYVAISRGVSKINFSKVSIPGDGWGETVSPHSIKGWRQNA